MKVFTMQLLFHFLIIKKMKSQNKTQVAYTFSFLNWLLEGKKKRLWPTSLYCYVLRKMYSKFQNKYAL